MLNLGNLVIKLLLLCCDDILQISAFKCGGNSCHPTESNKLNVHLIPHTHNDVGWLKTVDQYYYGANKGHAPFGVQYILDSVVSELLKNPARRFIYVESAYFWRWWEDLNQDGRKIVTELVNDGRLQFVHGGWCMSDEATPHYTAMIDQMTLGLKFLNETFGECGRPTVAWQIDPFGHSNEVAIEFAEMGFDGLFISRIDFEDHAARKASKEMEMVWRPDTSLGEAGNLFLNVMYDMYTSPSGFCFDTYCADEPIMDNKKFHGYNVEEKIKKFEEHVQHYRKAYKTNHILIPMGGDFTYTIATSWFKNIDKLIKYTNIKFPSLNLLYSTPSCYIKAINSVNTTWPVKDDDDFFPYGSDEHSYWTGYFTSRPAIKYMVYKANNILQGVKQLATELRTNILLEEEFRLKRAVGIAQHHDGVSGTEKQHVTDDYALYLAEGIQAGNIIFNRVFKAFYGSEYPEHDFGSLRNISQCEVTESDQNFVITLYNPSSRRISFTSVRFPVTGNVKYDVHEQSGSLTTFDIIPIPESILKLPGRLSRASYDIDFLVKDLPPMGVVNYYVQAKSTEKTAAKLQKFNNDTDLIIDNGLIQLVFNGTNGLLSIINKKGKTWPFHQNFYFYDAMKGYNYNADTRASGAYIFRPTKNEPRTVADKVNLTYFKGNYVQEVHQTFTSWLSQVVRLYNDSEDIEFEWLIGPIPIINWTGMEIVTRYTTDVISNSTFYTDSNGRRWIKRVRNQRKYWNLTVTEPTSCNYYPLTTAICLRDDEKQVTVITDRPQGGTSLVDGQLEIMLHRRLLYDDNKGVVEPLDETAYGAGLVVRGKHIVQMNNLNSAAEAHRMKIVDTAYGVISMFANVSIGLNEWVEKYNKNVSLLASTVPANIQISTLERWQENQLLLRLEHIFASNESAIYSKPTTINLQKLLSSFEVLSHVELTLGGNLEKKNMNRLKWRVQEPSAGNIEVNEIDKITLYPMQIRTFLLNVKKK